MHKINKYYAKITPAKKVETFIHIIQYKHVIKSVKIKF